jgi:hypothetical protein
MMYSHQQNETKKDTIETIIIVLISEAKARHAPAPTITPKMPYKKRTGFKFILAPFLNGSENRVNKSVFLMPADMQAGHREIYDLLY